MQKDSKKEVHAPKRLTLADLKNVTGGLQQEIEAPGAKGEDAAGNKVEVG